MTHEELEPLAQAIHSAVSLSGFKRIEPAPKIEAADMAAAWTRKTWNSNRGIALVSIPDSVQEPCLFAQGIKRQVGKALRYFPFIYELGLHLVVTGSKVFPRGKDLQQYIDKVNTFTVVLQSLHLVDVAAAEFLTGLPDLEQPIEEGRRTEFQQIMDTLRFIPRIGIYARMIPQDPMKSRLDYSRRNGRACRSARSWGLFLSSPDIDAIEEGVSHYLHTTP